jgi:hypothetical protein
MKRRIVAHLICWERTLQMDIEYMEKNLKEELCSIIIQEVIIKEEEEGSKAVEEEDSV